MSSGTDAWEQALGSRSGPSPRPAELPRATHSSRHTASVGQRRPAKPKTEKRRDIQGLRMIAVVAVVINHLTGHPKGGFVGVDVFFVISGYLITGLLIRDLGKSVNGVPPGPIRYVLNFYRRRIRRLFPAAILVVLLTLLVSHLRFTGTRYHNTWVDGWHALLFWANWRFIDVGTNYFTAGLPESPLQHYWSLSVEEQFYLVWPVALFLLAAALARGRSVLGRRVVSGSAAAVLIVVSLAFAFSESSSAPTTAYFSTFTRGWELGLGALLACAVPYLRASTTVLTAMSWVGMTMIAVSLFVTFGGSGFPAPGALLPCCGAAFVIAAISSDGARAHNGILTNGASVWIGDISYSVYLVHFPVIILLATYITDRSSYFYAGAVLLTLGLAAALYGLVERPILKSSWLQPKRAQHDAAAAADDPIKTRTFALTGALLVAFAFAAMTLWPGDQASIDSKYERVNSALDASLSSPAAGVVVPPLQAALTRQIAAALRADSYPTFHPSMDTVIGGPQAAGPFEKCADIHLSAPNECTWGNRSATHLIYVTGDSVSMVYAQALALIVEHTPGWKMRFAGAAGCHFNALQFLQVDKAILKGCPKHNTEVTAEVKQLKPDLLVVSNSTIEQLADGTNISIGDYFNGLHDALAPLTSSTRHIVLLDQPPPNSAIPACVAPGTQPIACVNTLTGSWLDSVVPGYDSLAARLRGAVVIDPTPWFCANNACPAFVGDTPVFRDSVHASPGYMKRIWPVMKEAFEAQSLIS